MKKKTLLFLPFFLFSLFSLTAQSQYEVLLKQGTIIPNENVNAFIEDHQTDGKEVVNGHFYRLLQFEAMPTKEEHQVIAQSGIELLEYLPHLTYIAAIPTQMDLSVLVDLKVRSVMTLTTHLKLDASLKTQSYGDWAIHKDKIGVSLKYHKNLREAELTSQFKADGITLVRSNGVNNFIFAHIDPANVAAIAALPYVAYLALEEAPGTPDDVEGRSLHRANTLDTSFPGGRKYTGEGVGVLCRDDGDIGPHIDFEGRLNSDFVGGFGGSHGDGVSGIMCGAGNLNPRNRGMAAGADLFATDYEADFLDETMDLHLNHNVLVTNSSYSNGCNDGYTTITATVDQQMNENPTFLHVFSAGNSNNQDCGYGAGNQWGNITGGHKQGKNVIATANVYADGSLVNSSSRGPAHDGRIKPDIAANGQDQISTDPGNEYSPFGGTSGAAPGIAGITAQLHQAYRELNGGAVADGALLKAVLLNSANDYGNVGPDFKFGWGIVNAYRAALTLEENRFFTGSVDQGQTQTHTIEVPAGVSQVKVMTYWREQESTVMTNKSLINNLDTRVVTGSETHLPWVLDETPNATSLDMPATKGNDVLNNVEQVAIDNPAGGTYTLEVTGTEIPSGSHDYYVVYEFLTPQPTLIFPIGGEAFVPGEVERIHWDAHGNGGTFILVYSVDGGNAWSQIGQVGGDQRMYEWTVPDDLTAKARVMVVNGSNTDMSDANFSITPYPQNLDVVEACPDYIRLEWDEVTGATSYEVFLLGQKYMESVGTSTTTTFDYPTLDPANDHWFAVRSLGDEGLISRRTNAINYDAGLLNCVIQNDLSVEQILAPGTGLAFACDGGIDENLSVLVVNNGATDQSDIMVAYQVDNETPVVEPLGMSLASGENTTYNFTEPVMIMGDGTHKIAAWTIIAEDGYNANDTSTVNFDLILLNGMIEPLDVIEDFETNVFPPENWYLLNDDDSNTWEAFATTQIDGTFGGVMRLDNYTYASANPEEKYDLLYTFPIDLTGAPEDIGLSFDVAYTQYESGATLFSDGLMVELSIDCGLSFPIVIYDKFGDDLNTVPNQAGVFEPSSPSDWRKEMIDLAPYIGSTIMIKFVNISGYGNNIFIDNINVASLVPLEEPVAQLSASELEICRFTSSTFTNLTQGDGLTYSWDFGNGAFPPSSGLVGPHTVNFAQAGTITVSLTATNSVGSSTATVDVTVIDVPSANFGFTNDLTTVTFENNSTSATTYIWDFGDGNMSNLENPVHTYALEGTYTVSLFVSGECGDETISTEITVLSTGIEDTDLNFDLLVAPNPNNGKFELVINSVESSFLQWDLFNLQGQSLKQGQLNTAPGATRESVDVSNFAAGIYLMKVRNKDGFRTMKVVVF